MANKNNNNDNNNNNNNNNNNDNNNKVLSSKKSVSFSIIYPYKNSNQACIQNKNYSIQCNNITITILYIYIYIWLYCPGFPLKIQFFYSLFGSVSMRYP